MLKIVLCSESPIKTRAAVAAIQKLAVGETSFAFCKAESGIADQPIGMDVMRRGAANRVDHAKKLLPDQDYYIAIENGLVQVGNEYFDVPCVVVHRNAEEHSALWGVAYGTFFPIPIWMVREIHRTGTELGVLVEQRAGGGEKDPMKYFSRGLLSREEILSQAIVSAFMEVLHRTLYQPESE